MKRFSALLFLILTLVFIFSFLPSSYAQQNSAISITPSQADLKINEEKIIAVQLNSSSKISGFDLRFKTSGPVGITDFVSNLSITNFNPFNVRQVTKNINGPDSRIAYVLTAPEESLPNTITLYAKISGATPGKGQIELDYNHSQILGGDGNAISVTPLSASYNLNPDQSSGDFINPGQIPPPVYPENTAVVNLKLKLYGINSNIAASGLRASAVAVGRIGEGKFETPPQLFELTPEATQSATGTSSIIFSGRAALPSFKDGNKFSLMLKVDKFLLRRICDTNPTEKQIGGYECANPSLTILQGNNNFDFTGVSLLPGDLGQVDGFVNGYDLSIVRNNINKNDSQSVNLADLNYDGIVNSEDFNIIKYIAARTKRQADQ